MPLEIGDKCYRMQFDPFRFGDARDNCAQLGGLMANVKTPEVMDVVTKLVTEYIIEKLDNANFWIGIKMDDTSLTKAAEDRLWVTDYDEEQFVQKDWPMWDTEGGPKDKGLTCAAINGTNDYKVKAVDCGGPRLPPLCMMKKGERCHHDQVPYLQYGPHCLAVIKMGVEYNKLHGSCNPNSPTPYKDEDMKQYVVMAARNSFLGGGVFQYVQKSFNGFIYLDDASPLPDDMWEDGEPRDEYDCVGLSLQNDNTLKLKTVNCNAMSASLCVINKPTEENED